MTKSKVFLYFCFSFIIGIFLGSLIKIPQVCSLGFLILGVFLIFLPLFFTPLEVNESSNQYKKDKPLTGFTKKPLWLIGFCILFLVLGISRYQAAKFKIENNELKKFNDLDEKLTLIGTISAEPDIRENHIKITINVKDINQDKSTPYPVEGKVLVTTNRYPEYQYGDKLKITGKLLTPKEFEDFNYKNYLAKDGIYSVIYWPEIEVFDKKTYRDPIPVSYAKILFFKNKLRDSIYRTLSPPQSSILGAMILGDKKRMSEELKEKLNIVGVRHITAISGMHIVILSVILMEVLIGLGFWRGQAFYLTLTFLILFIIMVGLPSSAIRAGIMGGLFLLAEKVGRLKNNFRILVFTAAMMLIMNPLLLRLDVGFQLSFLAVMGIIYLEPIFRNWLKFIPQGRVFNLRTILAITFSAQIFTLPILIYNFGRVSLIAPIANVLIVPLLSFIMISGFIFGLIGIVWESGGWIFSLPCWFLLTYLTKIIDFFSKIPLATLSLKISWIWLIIFYSILAGWLWRWNKKRFLSLSV